jgi:hypothetical protein
MALVVAVIAIIVFSLITLLITESDDPGDKLTSNETTGVNQMDILQRSNDTLTNTPSQAGDDESMIDSKSGIDTSEVTDNIQESDANHPPVADAGRSRTIDEGELVIMKGIASSDPDDDPLTYSWNQIWGPTVRLSNAKSVTPSFIAPEITSDADKIRLTFELTVNDGNSGFDSDIVDITVLNVLGNQSPTADAGPDQTVNEGAIVTLEGINSFDPDGDELTYFWNQIDGQTIESFSATSPNPRFRAPIIDNANPDVTLTFELTIEDGNGGKDSDTVVVIIENAVVNQPPVADAGTSLTVEQDILVALSGRDSFDPDGDSLAYSWNQTTGPSVSLTNSNSSSPTFYAPEVSKKEKLTFELKVNDGNQTSTDSVNVYINPLGSIHEILTTPDYMTDVASEISKARQFVYAAMYFAEPYPGNKIVNELEAAVGRGVEVRLMFDDETLELYPTVEQDFVAKGIPYKIVPNHAKVVVIDNSIAYVGSANWNKNGLENNWELSLKTKDSDAVREAYEFVGIMWEKGAKKVDNTERVERFANGIEFYNLLLGSVKSAQSVKVLMFQITYNAEDPEAADTKLLDEIKNANDRGANLRLLLDDPTYYERDGGRHFLVQNNIPHRLDEKDSGYLERLHAKAVLIDDKILFIGSQNWNYDSLDSPQEASIITSDKQAINDFLDIFDEKWDAGREPQ